MAKCAFFLTIVLYVGVHSDVYFHNPRGSNNRLDEARRARNNGNRMFDSQNNNRGGYNVGSLYYYEGSQLQIEWADDGRRMNMTNQHSCGGPNDHCELVVQYACGDWMRDGVTTSTIPENQMLCENYDCNTDTRYGMNEMYDHYLACKMRRRNGGLFTADQKLKGGTARYTRQNRGGTRRGYECPEERDYYPYWHPSPWKDIAVMTNDATRCPHYQAESENVKHRWACVLPYNVMVMNRGIIVPNNAEDCAAFRYPPNNANGTRAEWKEFPSHGLPAPECRETEFSRDNHLGNGVGGNPNLYNWTIPAINHEKCVLRIRYNISTADYDGWDSDVNSSLNQERRKGPESKLDLSEKFGISDFSAAKARGYVFKNNPQVEIFKDSGVNFRLAINTAQYGRTFQDRSHTFAVRRRPESMKDSTIHNLNVRGKRGNIVQVYPAVEYDFVPNSLRVAKGDYIHFQWTGSNTNPHNNDGQGRAGTDRSNVVLQGRQIYPEGTEGVAYPLGKKFGHWGRSYPDSINNSTFLGLSTLDRQHLALLGPGQFRGELSELDDAGTYFDLGPRKVTSTGTYHYMCTRNNNFSNRSQKGKLVCQDGIAVLKSIGWNGGNFTLPGKATINVAQGTFQKLVKLNMEQWPQDVGEAKVKSKGGEVKVGDNYASDFIVIQPEGRLTDKGHLDVTMNVDDSASSEEISVYRTNSENFATWSKVPAQIENGIASFQIQDGGVYVARKEANVGLIAGISIMCVVIVVAIVGTGIYCRRHPDKYQQVCTRFRNIQRSTTGQV